MMLLQLCIAIATLAVASAGWQEDDALMALERYVNKISNSMMYERVIGQPQIDISNDAYMLIAKIKDALLAPSSCTNSQADALKDADRSTMETNCPVPADARALNKCSATVEWDSDGAPEIQTASCGNPNN